MSQLLTDLFHFSGIVFLAIAIPNIFMETVKDFKKHRADKKQEQRSKQR